MFDFGLLFIPERRLRRIWRQVKFIEDERQGRIQLPTLQHFAAGLRQGTGRGHDGCQREESQHPYRGYFSLERVPAQYVARACVVQP